MSPNGKKIVSIPKIEIITHDMTNHHVGTCLRHVALPAGIQLTRQASETCRRHVPTWPARQVKSHIRHNHHVGTCLRHVAPVGRDPADSSSHRNVPKARPYMAGSTSQVTHQAQSSCRDMPPACCPAGRNQADPASHRNVPKARPYKAGSTGDCVDQRWLEYRPDGL